MTWNFQIKYDDPNNQLTDKATFSAVIQSVVDYLNKYILGTATMNMTVHVGAFGGFSGGGDIYTVGTLGAFTVLGPVAARELSTGTNSNGDTADIQIRVDPSSTSFKVLNISAGAFEAPTTIPKKQGDLQSVLLHEILHGFGVSGYRDFVTGQFPDQIYRSLFDMSSNSIGSKVYLDMPTFKSHGIAPVELTTTIPGANYYHFGNASTNGIWYVDDALGTTLEGTERRGLSKLDLYVLENLGFRVNIPEDLPLSYRGQYGVGQVSPSLANDFGSNSMASNTVSVRGTSAPGSQTSVLEGGVVLGTTTADSSGAWSLAIKVNPLLSNSSIYVRDGTNVADSAPVSIARSEANLELSASTIYPNVLGGNGNDRLIAGNENDTLDGGAGVDTAVFVGKRASFSTEQTTAGFSVTDKVGQGGIDRLLRVERIKFDDATIALTMDGVGETPITAAYTALAQEFYIAYFGRPADAGGLKSMVEQLIASNAPYSSADALVAVYSTNQTVRSIINNFGNSAESAALYTGNNSDFVRSIYGNVLGRAPEAEGLSYWAGAIDSGNLARGQAALSILAGAQRNTTPQGLIDGALVANRVVVASNFTMSLDTTAEQNAYSGNVAAATARTMLGMVSSSTAVVNFQSQVEQVILNLGQAHISSDTPAELIGVPHYALWNV